MLERESVCSLHMCLTRCARPWQKLEAQSEIDRTHFTFQKNIAIKVTTFCYKTLDHVLNNTGNRHKQGSAYNHPRDMSNGP